MPEQRLLAAMKREGWTEDLTFEASGPEGSAFAMRRGQALCHYDILFPGTPGDDEHEGANDSTIVAPDTTGAPLEWIVTILCMEDRAAE